MKATPVCLIAGLTAFSFMSVAQTATPPAGKSGVAFAQGVMGGFISPTMMAAMGPLQTVTGMPYSAEQITERMQTLADGTRITSPSQKVLLYRDSAGRTRTERFFAPPAGTAVEAKPFVIEVRDPAAGTSYMINQQNRTVHRSSWTPSPPLARNGAGPGRSAWFQSANAPQQPRLVPRSGQPVPATTATSGRPQPSAAHEDLGTRPIEGVNAQGTRFTVTYPEDFMGNDRPIVTVSERWTSLELKMDVLTTNSDPRNGDTTTRLINISRGEPDPSLFEIPSDYTVVDDSRPNVTSPVTH